VNPIWLRSLKPVTPILLAQGCTKYLTTSRKYQKTGELSDQQTVIEKKEVTGVIYQYRAKRAALDKRNIEKQVAKLEKALKRPDPDTRTKFLSIVARRNNSIRKLIDKATALAAVSKGTLQTWIYRMSR